MYISKDNLDLNKNTPVARKKLVSQTRKDSNFGKNVGNLLDSLKFDEVK